MTTPLTPSSHPSDDQPHPVPMIPDAGGAAPLLDGRVTLHLGDCLQVMADMPPDSHHASVTDPPYHFGSIIKRWSNTFSDAERATHRVTGAYGRHSRGFMGQTWDGGDVAFQPETWAAVLRVLKPGAHLVAFGAPKNVHRLTCAIEDAGFEIRDQLMWVFGTGFPKNHDAKKAMGKASDADLFREHLETAGGKWEGWGTALKPAYEPIVLARKPLVGSVQQNIREHGTGGINFDACRVHAEDAQGGAYTVRRRKPGAEMDRTGGNYRPEDRDELYHGETKPGRWPANLLHDGSDEVIEAFPARAGGSPVRGGEPSTSTKSTYGMFSRAPHAGFADEGSAARFFYCAKATKAERAGSKHPTVKPIALMRWLCRLVVPQGGLLLDPFAGTGTTAQAAVLEGMRATLIERSPEYQADIRHRLSLLVPSEAAE